MILPRLDAHLSRFLACSVRGNDGKGLLFPSADIVDHWIVFNIGGNKYRLIASIHFNRYRVYVRHVLTHKEYDRGAWKQ
ncbi:MAG: type II toxin-antitoxin system HigB family toxin [Candidatus Hydrogenedentes bacterium]|nr:type II toxin-antitoxin system HigB family toxin [Candidatus Hydrogenedentota bacterium]